MFADTIKRAKDGDRKAMGILYDMTFDKVYRSVFHRVLDTYIAEDIVSQVYMKVIKGLRSFRGDTEGEFFSWVLRIAYTTTLDSWRYQVDTDAIDHSSIEFWYSTDLAADIDTHDKLSEVLNYMEVLPERDRAIITMRIWDDLSYEEIAKISGESLSNAKKIVSRGLEKITANVSYCIIFSLILAYVI